MFEVTRGLTNQIKLLSENYLNDDSLIIDRSHSVPKEERTSELEEIRLPTYKKYSEKLSVNAYQDNILDNAKNNIARTAVITADRLVSALSAEQLNQHIEEASLDQLLKEALLNDRGLKTDIQTCLQGF